MRELSRSRVCLLLVGVCVGAIGRLAMASSNTVDPHTLLQRMAHAYDGIQDYTALFLKQERVNGVLLPLEKIELRFQEPFKISMAWREPYPGRTIIYIAGENNDKILVNPGGILQFLHLSLDPDSRLATRNSHYTVREAGLRKTIELLTREYERGMHEGVITLAFRDMQTVDGRPAYHIAFVSQADKAAGYVARRGDIWIDQEHYLPTKVLLYDWNDQLYAHYEYHRLQLNPGLGPEAFRLSPAPQVYSFPETENGDGDP